MCYLHFKQLKVSSGWIQRGQEPTNAKPDKHRPVIAPIPTMIGRFSIFGICAHPIKSKIQKSLPRYNQHLKLIEVSGSIV